MIKSGFVVLFAGGTAADVEYHSSCLLGRKQERTNSCLFIPPLGRRGGKKNRCTNTPNVQEFNVWVCIKIHKHKKKKTLIWEKFRFGPYGHERALCWFDCRRSLPESPTRKHSHTQTFPPRKAVFVLRCSAGENTLLTHLNKVLSLIFRGYSGRKEPDWSESELSLSATIISSATRWISRFFFYIFQFKDCEPELLYICRDACIFQPSWAWKQGFLILRKWNLKYFSK